MAVPFSHAATSYLDNYDRDINDMMKRADGIVAVLGGKGKIVEETGGGDNFRVRIAYGSNPNVGFGSTTGQVTTAQTEAKTMASVPQRFIKGAITLNDVELARATKQSEWALGDYIKEEVSIAKATYVKEWADKLRQSAPGASDPFTLLPSNANVANGILAAQAKASQTATTAGISRADNDWWRNAYSNSSIDISSEAGRSLLQQLYLETVFGSGVDEEPDFGLTNALTISDLTQSINTNNRQWNSLADTFVAKYGLKGIMFENAMLIRDSSSQFTNKVAFLNSRYLYIKFLRMITGSGMPAPSKENWDQNNDMGFIPVNVYPFVHDIDSFHWVSLFNSLASLVPASLRHHALADNVV